MRIGIDIDDVITDTSLSMKDYIMKYDKTGEVKEHIEEIMRGEANTPAIKNFFIEHMLDVFKNAKVKENAHIVMQNFLDAGHELIIITSRGEKNFRGSKSLTLDYLKSNNINYTKIILNCSDKAKICKDNNIDLMIDDSVKYCEEIRNENIKSIVFTSVVNKTITTAVPRVDNWLELEKMINNMI